MSKLCWQQARITTVETEGDYWHISKEIDRLMEWAIATNPRRGTISRGERTRKKIYTLIVYWTLKAEGIKNAIS